MKLSRAWRLVADVGPFTEQPERKPGPFHAPCEFSEIDQKDPYNEESHSDLGTYKDRDVRSPSRSHGPKAFGNGSQRELMVVCSKSSSLGI